LKNLFQIHAQWPDAFARGEPKDEQEKYIELIAGMNFLLSVFPGSDVFAANKKYKDAVNSLRSHRAEISKELEESLHSASSEFMNTVRRRLGIS